MKFKVSYIKKIFIIILKLDLLSFCSWIKYSFGLIEPREDIDVFMIAPKGPGHTVRSEYQKGGGVPSLISVFQNKSGNAFEIAWHMGLDSVQEGRA